MARSGVEPDRVTLHLDGFDSHGTTRARLGGRWIEVEHGIPGETVRAEVFGGRRPRGRIVEVLAASPDRIEPPCPYFREWQCGGCQWQQIAYESQVSRKQEMIESAMQAEGLPLMVSATHTLDDPWRYRSTAGISLGKRAGFRRHGSLAIVPLHDCPISHSAIGRLMAQLNECIDTGRLPDFRGRLRLEVRVANVAQSDTLQVLIRPSEQGPVAGGDDLRRLTEVLSVIPDVTSLLLARPERPVEVLAGDLFVSVLVADRSVTLSAASFFQTNLRLLPRLIERLREGARPTAGKRMADIYGGVGLLGLFLALDGGELTVIDADSIAVAAGMKTANDWNLTNVRFEAVQAEDALVSSHDYNLVIVDPPRSGLTEEVRAALMSSRPETILYVSCLPESLARDLAYLMSAGYRVENLELFDFYPQTYHVEILAVLRRG